MASKQKTVVKPKRRLLTRVFVNAPTCMTSRPWAAFMLARDGAKSNLPDVSPWYRGHIGFAQRCSTDACMRELLTLLAVHQKGRTLNE